MMCRRGAVLVLWCVVRPAYALENLTGSLAPAPAPLQIPAATIGNVWGDENCSRWILEDGARCVAPNYQFNCAMACHDDNELKHMGAYSKAKLNALVFFVVLTFIATGFCCRTSKHVEYAYYHETKALNAAQTWEGDPSKTISSISEIALEGESHANFDCACLLLNRPWQQNIGKERKAPSLSSNVDWLEGVAFPNGEENRKSRTLMLLGLWKFLYKRTLPHKIVCIELFRGVCPALHAQVLSYIVNQFSITGHTEQLVFYLAVYVLIGLARDRATWLYEVDVPGASVRYELRVRLQRVFLTMKEDEARAWPSGRCSAVLNYDVSQITRKGWFAFFKLVRNTSNAVALTAVLVWNSKISHRSPLEIVLATFEVLAVYFCCHVALRVRQANFVDLYKRKRDWMIVWLGLVDKQIDGCRADLERGKMHQTAEVDSAMNVFGSALLVYRVRAFHAYFVRLASVISADQTMLFMQAAIMFRAGRSVLKGETNVGEAMALYAVSKALTDVLTTSAEISCDMSESLTSIVNVAKLFDLVLPQRSEYESSEACDDADSDE